MIDGGAQTIRSRPNKLARPELPRYRDSIAVFAACFGSTNNVMVGQGLNSCVGLHSQIIIQADLLFFTLILGEKSFFGSYITKQLTSPQRYQIQMQRLAWWQLILINLVILDSPMRTKRDSYLIALLLLNCVMFAQHLYRHCQDIFYFFQLTIITQNMVIANFILSIVMHESKSTHSTRKLLSRFHLVTLSVEAIVVIGFWGLRIFFTKGIIEEGQVYSLYDEVLTTWVHGGACLTMFYFIKIDQIVLEPRKRVKYLLHLCWGIPYVFIQYMNWYLTGEHVYGFLKYFNWVQLIVFELSLYYIAVAIDYSLTLRHGLHLSLRHMKSSRTTIEDLQIQKQQQESMKQIQEEAQIRLKKAELKKLSMKRNKSQ